MSRILLFAFVKNFAKKQNICHTSRLFVVSLILQLQFYRLKIKLVRSTKNSLIIFWKAITSKQLAIILFHKIQLIFGEKLV